MHDTYVSLRATAERLREQPNHNANNSHNENYAGPDARFKNVANHLAAGKREGQKKDYQKIDVSFHEKELFRLVMFAQPSKTIP